MTDYERVARVIQHLDRHHTRQPGLGDLAAHAGLSPFHFQRLFARWAGVTPKEFLQCLTIADARARLRRGESVLQTALEVGLSGPGRLHDLSVSLEAASPGELKDLGRGWTIAAGFADTPFGSALVGIAPRGFCHLSFVEIRDRKAGAAGLLADWPEAELHWDDEAIAARMATLFGRPVPATPPPALKAIVRGSAFQVQVWRALLRIPPGALVSYGAIARTVARPTASRAVGTAVGRNPLAWLIPCHRVIRETGALGEYRWGRTRKSAIAAWEAAQSLGEAAPSPASPL